MKVAETSKPINYYPNTDVERFFSNIMLGDKEKIKMINILSGCLLTGETFDKIIVLRGPSSSGKTTYINMIKEVLGPKLCTTVTKDFFIKNDKKSIDKLRGIRVVILDGMSDEDKLNRKQIERIFLSSKGKYPMQFKSIISTNSDLKFDEGNEPLKDNLLVIEFKAKFVDLVTDKTYQIKRDEDLIKRLMSEKGKQSLLNHFIQYAQVFYKEGIFIPKDYCHNETFVLSDKINQDSITKFIKDRLIVTNLTRTEAEQITNKDAGTQALTLFKEYESWCKQNDITEITQTAFGIIISKRFPNSRRRFTSASYYLGLKIKED